ncbi:3-isopropylmalate/(R)-2-methylmalate dehydratase large subunit [Variovorax boronicumulans]|uniref:3-isopropylmalate/(R)-2-methylmalate dehydratase large subunit n=1 Tax=Variovorax boronicumulans TaxID=436515 RepID=A0AAW8DTV6_9BURK|nr:aconitase family protein [Variovorax boronicumulans]MDP9877709.1 3-isopropylmalate/(R)-2-methylmalate dehydratase large subunit [Variovorax boronicumulans]MDP9922993.1 3-isopropylmalate/(R)-2-methylmalate dehydratase large subunit [Variovorax boronicumulans]
MTEKILARASGRERVRPGEEITARPDFVIAYDFPGYTDVFFRETREDFGIEKVSSPERFVLFIDHMVPATAPKEEELHKITRAWGQAQGVPVYEREGIGHQVSAERGYATPGAFVVHFDGHVSQLGAFGAFAFGARKGVLESFVTEMLTLTVPATVKVELTGTLQPGVMARDVFHHMVRVMGPASCRFKAVELCGPVIAAMSIEGRQTLCGQAMFLGATTMLIAPDAKTLAYAEGRSKIALAPVYPDADATYERVVTIDVSSLEPIVVVPPSPANTRDLQDYVGLQVHTGYLGSCASGRLEDLRIAAQVLRGRQIQPGFLLHVVPTSKAIMAAAAREGLIEVLVDAGAFISSPSCDYCFGRIATMSSGQRAVSTGTLNTPGRMGSVDSEIYICNAAVVAASALEGKIADPRPYLVDAMATAGDVA